MDGAVGDGGEPPRPPILRLAAVFYTVVFSLALLWAAVAGRGLLFADASAAARGVAWGRDLAAGALAGGLVVLLSHEFTRRTRMGEELARTLAAVLGPLELRTCVLLALLSGVAEEAFFRGALQPTLGWVLASLAFGLAHFAPRRELLPWTAFSLAAGFGLGWLFEATGNLVAPVTAHVVVNAVNLRLLSLRYAPPA